MSKILGLDLNSILDLFHDGDFNQNQTFNFLAKRKLELAEPSYEIFAPGNKARIDESLNFEIFESGRLGSNFHEKIGLCSFFFFNLGLYYCFFEASFFGFLKQRLRLKFQPLQ